MGAPRRISKRTGIRTTIHEDVLTGDVAGVRRAQERASGAKLLGATEPPRRITGLDIPGYLLNGTFCIRCERLQIGFQSIGIEGGTVFSTSNAVWERRIWPGECRRRCSP